MHFTIESDRFLQALKRLDIRRFMYPYICMSASKGQLRLLSFTSPYNPPSLHGMQVSLEVDAVTIDEEGRCAVDYDELVHAMKAHPGMLTVELQEHALLVSGAGPYIRQTPIELLKKTFPGNAFPAYAEHECYSKERKAEVQCDHCKESHSVTMVDTYQVTQVMKQHLHMSRDLLAGMCAQVAWVAEPENAYSPVRTAVQIELKNDVLSLIAMDGHCVVRRKHMLAGAGSWVRPVCITAAHLVQALRLFPQGEDLLIETTTTQHQLIMRGEEAVSDTEPPFQEQGLSLSTDTMHIILAPIASTFPHYPKVFSSVPMTSLSCSTVDFLHAMNATMPAGKSKNHIIQLTCDPTTLLVEAKRYWITPLAQYEISIDPHPDREKTMLMLRAKYVWSFLKAASASEIRFAFTDLGSPVVFHAGGELDDYSMSVLPMELQK